MKKIHLCLSLAVALLASCSKDNESPAPEDKLSTTIYDMPGDTLASMGDIPGKERRPFHTLIFRFSDKSSQLIKNAADSATYLKKDDWDLAFSKEYNSLVVINSGTAVGTPGFGGPGLGRMVIVEKAYDQVNEAPSDEAFAESGVDGVGWDAGNGIGWYFYSLQNHICVPVKNRTFVIKTAKGKYAKLALLNIYKSNPAVVTDLFWPAPYITFKYFVQEDGSRNLKTI